MRTISDINKNLPKLPALEISDSLNQELERNNVAIVTAPPGAGKSTILPLTVLYGLQPAGKILMLEPRRLAARQIAERMANIIGERVGETIGYRVRFDSKTSDQTRIEVLTEGILTRMIVDDPTLDGVSVVIFDEFHERSINSDLAMALTRQTQQVIRDDLRMVVMSATINTSELSLKLKSKVIESNGRMYPVKVIHSDREVQRSELVRTTCETILKAHREHEGDILVFLPGQSEIQSCADMIGDALNTTSVCPLYGNLSIESQRKAILPSQAGNRKVVLATPIAETSLTIEGVRIVVDSGYCRKVVFDPRNGLSHLETVRISKDMATQRAGRAGRITEGICYRLWTLATEHRMAEQRKPEIETLDLTQTVLQISAFGEKDMSSLPWIDLPPTGNIAQAKQLLNLLGATDETGTITRIGKRMAAMPCHPRIAKMILNCTNTKSKSIACDISAILEEKDPFNVEEYGTDITLRINALRSYRSKAQEKQVTKWTRIEKISKEYRQITHTEQNNEQVDSYEVGTLIATAYPERIAIAIDNIGNYRLANGKHAKIENHDSLFGNQWIAIASLYSSANSGRVFLAAEVNVKDLPTTTYKNVKWDSKQQCIVMRQEQRVGELTVDSKPIQNADKQAIADIICNALKKDGLSMLDWTDSVKQLQTRVSLVTEWHPEIAIPDITTAHLLETAHDWLPLYLEENNQIKTSSSELKKLNLREIIWASIPYDIQKQIDEIAPTHVVVPTGSHIKIDYRVGAPAPVISVRLQECFGLKQTPCVDYGKRPVLMELLSPGYKPVQLTQDLTSFWSGTYFEVRKELKRRYPKHYWPENPLEAEAVKGVKRK